MQPPVDVRLSREKTYRYDSNVSTAVTIKRMRERAHEFRYDPAVVCAVHSALTGRTITTQRDIACAIFHWVRLNVKFTEDEPLMYYELGVPEEDLDKELLITPPVLLAMPQPQGDCDDFTLLIASMLLCCSIQPYFVTTATDPDDPLKLSHIYVCAKLADEGSHICLDAGNRLPMVAAGWESTNVTRKAIWRV